MNGKVGEAYKYVLQDTSRVSLGAKYSYGELLEDTSCPFKFQTIIQHYILKDADPSDTLESVFYYMEKGSFSYKTYYQLKARVKYSRLTEVKSLLKGRRKVYREYTSKLEEFVQIPLEEKKEDGIYIQEIILSKLAMMGFTV
ncbi:MAG: hypothetical protein K5682_04785 [Lachnospiraceae bacterium]|nr:hypothetical protein [Lachnospiraceae bacterium]